MQFSLGIRIVAFISLLLGLILLGGCSWTYHQFATNQYSGDSSSSNYLYSGSNGQHFEGDGHTGKHHAYELHEIEQATSKFIQIKKEWKKFKPFLMGSGGVALASGLVQILTSLLILCSGPKGGRERTGCFKMTHFVLGIALIISLAVPAVFDLQHKHWSDRFKHALEVLENQFHEIMKNEFNPDTISIYYAVIAIDIIGIVAIILSTCCLMRNAEYDYREYP